MIANNGDSNLVKMTLSRICRNDCKNCKKYGFCSRAGCLKEDNDTCYLHNAWKDTEEEVRYP